MPYALIVTLLTLVLGQQASGAGDDSAAAPTPESQFEGIWLTPGMVDRLLDRWVESAGRQFELTESQTDQFAAQLRGRWPAFLKEHRPLLQPLINEYLDARLAGEPPEADHVQRWATRAEPVFEAFRRNIRGTYDELSELMTPAQQSRLSLENIKINTRLHRFESRLEMWQQGRFEESDWWEPGASAEQSPLGDRHADASAVEERSSAAESKIGEELERWDGFVSAFIRKYRLDDRQSEAAFSILRECKQRVRRYVERYRARLEHLEKLLSQSDETTEELRQEAFTMYAPIDAIFVDLKTRIEQIPTRAQKEAVQAREAAASRNAPDDDASPEPPASRPR